ncbi:MAG: biotin--[acetyl-CoA-carboxylase] ligase [Lachnospiraceae bacterium]|nr:biotin--[acetyl-CoA-carboxylase] ligase [Lachnospiraceae bacterium]
METDIKIIDVVDSTNTVLEKLADEGAAEGTCVVSFCQTKGQGRSGRSFFSPEGGNLYMSLLLRPKDPAVTDMITVMSAVAVIRALKERYGIEPGIKWVNDIILGGRKICGMVARARNIGQDAFHVILGIGVNIYDPENIPSDIADIYGSVTGRKCDIAKDEQRSASVSLAKTILREFANLYEHFDKAGTVDEYRRNCIVIGKRVSYISGNDTTEARVLDIDQDGGIVLETNGCARTYRDGEIRIRLQDM